MRKDVVELRVHGPKIFRAFVTKPHFGFSLLKADQLKQTVELQTSPSWFSWGETLAVTVVNGDSGCRVVIESRRTLLFNPVANPAKAAAKLVSALAETYGGQMAPPRKSEGETRE